MENQFGKELLETTQVGKYEVKVYNDNNDVLLRASGFTMYFPEKPNASYKVKRDKRPAAALLDDKMFLHFLVDTGERHRAAVQSAIREEWGPRSFSADESGCWHHPLFESSGKSFSCIHCEKTFTGAEVAANLWHCPDPNCDGSPIDLRSTEKGS